MSETLQQDTPADEAGSGGVGHGGVVHILGTLPATWLAIGQALRQALTASGATASLMPDDAAAAPATLGVVFVDSPARVLAQWVASGEAGSAPTVLQTWRDSATRLLKLVHRNADRCLLIDVAEATRAPAELVRALAGRHAPLRDMPLEFDAPAPPDALCMALARHLCSSDVVSAELFDELHAASVVLGDAAPAPVAPDGPVDRYRALLAAERRCAEIGERGAAETPAPPAA